MGLLVTVLGTHPGVGYHDAGGQPRRGAADGRAGSRSGWSSWTTRSGTWPRTWASQPAGAVTDAATLAAGSAGSDRALDLVEPLLTPLAPGLTGLLAAPRPGAAPRRPGAPAGCARHGTPAGGRPGRGRRGGRRARGVRGPGRHRAGDVGPGGRGDQPGGARGRGAARSRWSRWRSCRSPADRIEHRSQPRRGRAPATGRTARPRVRGGGAQVTATVPDCPDLEAGPPWSPSTDPEHPRRGRRRAAPPGRCGRRCRAAAGRLRRRGR